MTLHVKKGTDWKSVYAKARSLAPEAFEADRINNLIKGEWASVGTPSTHVNPVDQMPIEGPPKIDRQTAIDAVVAAARQHKSWGLVDLDERKARVKAGLVVTCPHESRQLLS